MPAAKSKTLREQALARLAEGASLRIVARELGVGKSTLADWAKQQMVEVQMGDQPGHEFHGNQWVAGASGLAIPTDEKLRSPSGTYLGADALRAKDSFNRDEIGTLVLASTAKLQDTPSAKPPTLVDVRFMYQTAAAWRMNVALRAEARNGSGDREIRSAAWRANVGQMDHLMAATAVPIEGDHTVYRGARMDEVPQEGATFHDAAFVSTSTRPDWALNAMGTASTDWVTDMTGREPGSTRVFFRIGLPSGSPILPLGGSQAEQGREFVLNRDANFRVDKVTSFAYNPPFTQYPSAVVDLTYLGSNPVPVSAKATTLAAAEAAMPDGARFLWNVGDLTKVIGELKLAEDDQPAGSLTAADSLIASGLVVKAQDTGRVLMLQRSFEDPEDPAAGTWEWPGGNLDGVEEDPFVAAKREWQEELGVPLPDGEVVGSWISPNGVYQGFLYSIPSEDLIDLTKRDQVADPDGDYFEAAAWWMAADVPGMPALRPECLSSDWQLILRAGKATFGDQPGHPFRGNQHTGGIGGDAPAVGNVYLNPGHSVGGKSNQSFLVTEVRAGTHNGQAANHVIGRRFIKTTGRFSQQAYYLGRTPEHTAEWTHQGSQAEFLGPVQAAENSQDVPDPTAAVVEPDDIIRAPEMEHSGERPEPHVHDPDDPEAVLVFDLHGTLTKTNGFPLIHPPFPGIKAYMDMMVARGCCIHIATAGLDELDEMVNDARMDMIWTWCQMHALPVSHVGAKQNADVYYDDRMIEVDSENPDWAAYAVEAQERMLEKFDLDPDSGKYMRRPSDKEGEEITEFPKIEDSPIDRPRGFTSSVFEADVHRCISFASGSQRTAPLKPGALEVMTALYQAGYTNQVGCAGWNPATHPQDVWEGRYAAQGQYLYEQGIPFDRRVSKDHGDLFHDDKGLRHVDWFADFPRILAKLHKPKPAHNIPMLLGEASRTRDSVFVAFVPAPIAAQQLALDLNNPRVVAAEDLHLTLAYLGKADVVGDTDFLRSVVSSFASVAPVVAGRVNGQGRFTNGEVVASYWSLDSSGIQEFRARLVDALERAGYPVDRTHGFTPHITTGYDIEMPLATPQVSLEFGELWLFVGSLRFCFPLAERWLRYSEKTDQADSLQPKPKRNQTHELEDKLRTSQNGVDNAGDWETKGPALRQNDQSTPTDPGELQTAARKMVQERGSVDEKSGTGLERGVREQARDVSALGGLPGDREMGQTPVDLGLHDHPVLNRIYIEAMNRYANLVMNGVARHHALAAVQRIDPDFYIQEAQHAWLYTQLQNRSKAQAGHAATDTDKPDPEPGMPTLVKMGELDKQGLEMAIAAFEATGRMQPELLLMGWSPPQPKPPPHVTNVYDAYEWASDDSSALADYLSGLYRDQYLETLNDHLTRAGASTVDGISDPDILAMLDQHAQDVADGVGDSFNNDLANQTYATWIDQRSELGTQSSQTTLADEIDAWAKDRADWKSDQIAATESGWADHQAADDFVQNNPEAASTGHVEGDDPAACAECQALMDQGTMDAADLMAVDFPVHPNCGHRPVYNLDSSWGTSADDVWAAQAPDEADPGFDTAAGFGEGAGHEFHGNQWIAGAGGTQVDANTGAERTPVAGNAPGWPANEAAFKDMVQDPKNPSQTMSGKPIGPDTQLLVFHATTPDDAKGLLKYGLDPSAKPMTLARMNFESGKQATFAPGQGVSNGLYVGGHPIGVSGYGRAMVAVNVRAGDLSLPPEVGLGDPLRGLSHGEGGAVITTTLPPSAFRAFGTDPKHIPSLSYDELKLGENAGHPFHGNQYVAGEQGGAFEGRSTEDKIQHLVDQHAFSRGQAEALASHQSVDRIHHYYHVAPVDEEMTPHHHERDSTDLKAPPASNSRIAMVSGQPSIPSMVAAGEEAGHDFHGNQWTGGQGGGSTDSRAAYPFVPSGTLPSEPKAGYVRLYRGEGGGSGERDAGGKPGLWYTTDRESALYYSKDPNLVRAVDVPRKVAMSAANSPIPAQMRGDGELDRWMKTPLMEFRLPKQWADKGVWFGEAAIFGDLPGHDFHGNQYTGGSGGDQPGGEGTPRDKSWETVGPDQSDYAQALLTKAKAEAEQRIRDKRRAMDFLNLGFSTQQEIADHIRSDHGVDPAHVDPDKQLAHMRLHSPAYDAIGAGPGHNHGLAASEIVLLLGDAAGHDFHGNQWVAGDGGSAPLPSPRGPISPSVLAGIKARAEAFYRSGGSVVQFSGDQYQANQQYRDLVEQGIQKNQALVNHLAHQVDTTAEEERAAKGPEFMVGALSPPTMGAHLESSDHVLIALGPRGDPVAALSYEDRSPGANHVNYVGSTREIRGAATAVEVELARNSPGGVRAIYAGPSEGFHRLMGRELSPGVLSEEGGASHWSSQASAQVAALSIDKYGRSLAAAELSFAAEDSDALAATFEKLRDKGKLTFGDVVGHDFHGNQWVAGIGGGGTAGPHPVLPAELMAKVAEGRFKRSEMPVVPSHSAEINDFMTALQEQGVSAQLERADPRSLIPTQNELDPAKVNAVLTDLRARGGGYHLYDERTLVVSKDGRILDGHHRWAGHVLYAMQVPEHTVRVLRVNTDIDRLMALTRSFDQVHGLVPKSITALSSERPPVPDPDQPWLWVEGQWVLIATDDSDGVPRKLTFGDLPGHDFHGNQWTGGIGGGDSADDSGSRPPPAVEAANLALTFQQAAQAHEKAVTSDLQSLGDQIPGARLVGLDFRLKSASSMARKIGSDAEQKGITQGQAAAEIHDALRYTYTLPGDEDHSGNINRILDGLREKGYTVDKIKNFWDSSGGYKGVNTQISTRDAYTFELQFHTPESFDLKENVNHPLYERARDLATNQAERDRLVQEMADNSNRLPVPSGILALGR